MKRLLFLDKCDLVSVKYKGLFFSVFSAFETENYLSHRQYAHFKIKLAYTTEQRISVNYQGKNPVRPILDIDNIIYANIIRE